MKKSRPRRKGKPKGNKKDYQQTLALVDRLGSMQLKLFRRLANGLSLGTNGAGVIPLSSLTSSANVNAYPDFSSIASLYTAYRVHAFKCSFFPVLKVNTTAVNAPPYVVVAPFRGGLAPTSLQQLQESPDASSFSGYDRAVATVNYNGDNDAHLWTPTNAAVASSESFGLVVAGSSMLATSSTNTFYVYIEVVVEFRVTG